MTFCPEDVAGTVRGRCPDCAESITLPVTWDCGYLDYDADPALWRRIFRAHVNRSGRPHWSPDIAEPRPWRAT